MCFYKRTKQFCLQLFIVCKYQTILHHMMICPWETLQWNLKWQTTWAYCVSFGFQNKHQTLLILEKSLQMSAKGLISMNLHMCVHHTADSPTYSNNTKHKNRFYATLWGRSVLNTTKQNEGYSWELFMSQYTDGNITEQHHQLTQREGQKTQTKDTLQEVQRIRNNTILSVRFITAFSYDAFMQRWAQLDCYFTEAINTLCTCFGLRTVKALTRERFCVSCLMWAETTCVAKGSTWSLLCYSALHHNIELPAPPAVCGPPLTFDSCGDNRGKLTFLLWGCVQCHIHPFYTVCICSPVLLPEHHILLSGGIHCPLWDSLLLPQNVQLMSSDDRYHARKYLTPPLPVSDHLPFNCCC